MEITRDMTIEQVLLKHPQAIKAFHQFQMGCISCMGAAAESIEKGALMHGVNIEELLAALNKVAAEK